MASTDDFLHENELMFTIVMRVANFNQEGCRFFELPKARMASVLRTEGEAKKR